MYGTLLYWSQMVRAVVTSSSTTWKLSINEPSALHIVPVTSVWWIILLGAGTLYPFGAATLYPFGAATLYHQSTFSLRIQCVEVKMCALGLNRLVGLGSFLIVAFFGHSCAQGTSKFISPFVGVFKLAERTCPSSMPEWGCCCPTQLAFNSSAIEVNGTKVKAIPTARLKVGAPEVNASGLSVRLQLLYTICTVSPDEQEIPFFAGAGRINVPRTLSLNSSSINYPEEDEGIPSIDFSFALHFQLSLDNNRLHTNVTYTFPEVEFEPAPDQSVAVKDFRFDLSCNYARFPQIPSESPGENTATPLSAFLVVVVVVIII